jgi:hypothetical protein
MDWWLTSVYCPPRDADKPAFITELQELRSLCSGPWLLTGDFNMIYRAEDKNNNRLNRQLMGQFRHFINEADLKELHLNGRLFTWSNERTHPTLERIDRAFISKEWDELYPYNDLHSLSSMCSDHAPLPLRMDNLFIYKKRFHFCCFWTRFPATRRSSSGAWQCPLRDVNPCRRLDWLLRNTLRVLKSWSDKFIGNVRVQLEVAKEVVHRLEMARDRRQLATHEEELRQHLKLKPLGLASLQRTIAQQESRLLWLSEEDAPTKFFHCHANARQRNNHIHSLVHEGQTLVAEDRKAEVTFEFFDEILGTSATRSNAINLE